jgi:hypothetical protein
VYLGAGEFTAPALSLSLKDMDALSLRNGWRVPVATDLVIAIQIGVTGFEPATSWSQTTRSTKLSYTPVRRLMNITRCNPAHLESW